MWLGSNNTTPYDAPFHLSFDSQPFPTGLSLRVYPTPTITLSTISRSIFYYNETSPV